MNRIQFYNKLNKAKDEVLRRQIEHSSIQNNFNSRYIKIDDYYGINKPKYFTEDEFRELKHSTEYGKQHYAKIDNYYPDGRARYFWSRQEWEAYQRDKGQDEFRRQQEAKKVADQRSGMSGYDDWNKQRKENAQNGVKKLYSDYTENKKLQKIYNESENKAMYEELGRKAKVHNQQVKNYDNNKKAGEALENAEKQKWEKLKKENNPMKTTADRERDELKKSKDAEQKAKYEANKSVNKKRVEQLTEEIEKLKGKANLLKNRDFKKDSDYSEYKRLNEQIKNKEESLNNAKELLKKEREEKFNQNMSSKEKAIKEGQEAIKKGNEQQAKENEKAAEEARQKEIREWTEKSSNEFARKFNAIVDNLEECAGSRDAKFTQDGILVEMLEAEIRNMDPEFDSKFDGSLAKYIRPWIGNIYDKTHTDLVAKALGKMHVKFNQALEEATYDDIQYDTYLAKKDAEKKENINRAINTDLAKARISLNKMYNGDSKSFDLDPSLKKVLDKKIRAIDDDYNGNLYKYVRPWLFDTFIKDDDSYNTVKDLLNEIEDELKNANSNSDVYSVYLRNVAKLV